MLCPDEVISQCLFGNKYKLKALVTLHINGSTGLQVSTK